MGVGPRRAASGRRYRPTSGRGGDLCGSEREAVGAGWGRLRQGVWAGACRPRSLLSPPRPGRLRVHVRRRPAASDAAEPGRHAPQAAGSGLLTPRSRLTLPSFGCWLARAGATGAAAGDLWAARGAGGAGWMADRAWGAAVGALASNAIVGGRAIKLSFAAQSSLATPP